MKKNYYLILSFTISTFFALNTSATEIKLRNLPRHLSYFLKEQINSQQLFLSNEEISSNQKKDEIWAFSQINLKTYAYIEYEIAALEVKISPYIELRWNRKNPNGYKNYHPNL